MTYHGADPNAFDSGALAAPGHARRGEIMRLKMRSSTSILCLAAFWMTALFLTANTAIAQFPVQYTPPGGPQQRPESRREELERALAEARYRLGPVRIAPWATLRDIAYVRSLLSSGQGQRLPSDLTATVGAGFRAYLRNGAKATWTAQVLPEYAWWQKQIQRRQLNGRYLLGYNGYFNHLTVEVQAGRQQGQQVVTPEVPVPVSTRVDGGELVAELRLSHALSLFTVTAFNRQNNVITDDPLTGDLRLLDRDERAERLGVRWRPEQRWSVALAGERSESDFTHRGALDRSNSGTAPVVEVHFRGNHFGLQADAADRSLTARRGTELVPFHGVTGNAALDVGGSQTRATATLYSSRTLDYSLSPLYSYLTDERLGAALTVGFGQRTRGRIFTERGRNDYTAFSAVAPRRRDDVTSFGGSVIVELRRSLRLGIEGVRSRYDSNLPGASRSYTSVGATVTLADIR
ncbi:MAG: hypothetical protein ACJ76Y_19955 [Thermoanaerobaculia bacterium]